MCMYAGARLAWSLACVCVSGSGCTCCGLCACMHVQVYVVASMCLCVRVWLCVLWFYVHVCACTAQCVNPCNYVQRFAHRATFEEPHKTTHSGIFDGMVHETARKQAQYVVESPSTFSRYSRGNATQTQNPRVPPLAEVFVLRFAAIVVNLRTAFASVGNDGRAHKCRTACQAGRFPAIRIKNLQNPSSHISASFSCEFVAVAKNINSNFVPPKVENKHEPVMDGLDEKTRRVLELKGVLTNKEDK